MMGTKIRSFTPLPPYISLDDLVPEDFNRVCRRGWSSLS